MTAFLGKKEAIAALLKKHSPKHVQGHILIDKKGMLLNSYVLQDIDLARFCPLMAELIKATENVLKSVKHGEMDKLVVKSALSKYIITNFTQHVLITLTEPQVEIYDTLNLVKALEKDLAQHI